MASFGATREDLLRYKTLILSGIMAAPPTTDYFVVDGDLYYWSSGNWVQKPDVSNEVGGKVPLLATPDQAAAFQSLVSGDGTVNLREWNGYDNTGTHSMLSIIQQAIQQLEAYGYGSIELEGGTFAMDGYLYVRGGKPTLNGGYQGGIDIRGRHMAATKLQFSAGGIIIDSGPQAQWLYANGDQAMLRFGDMQLIGPGVGAGTVGLDFSPQDAHQNTHNGIIIERMWLDGFNNLVRIDDGTSIWMLWNYFLNYNTGIRLGHNNDSTHVYFNRFGDNQTAIGSQTSTTFKFDFVSPNYTGAASLGIQNVHVRHNWFMRQALVADIWDTAADNIVFEGNQFESCKHYAQIGKSGSVAAPRRVEFKQNTFMRTDGQEQTQAMFHFQEDTAQGSLHLIRNVCDSTTGPKYGWVKCGTASTVEFDTNTLPVSGGYVVKASHIIVGASGKEIVVPGGGKYWLNAPGGVNGGTVERQTNFSSRDNYPEHIHWGYNTSASASIYQRWQAKALASETVSGNAYDIKNLTINGTRYATAVGYVQPYSAASLPSLGSDGAVARAGIAHTQGAAGVWDGLYVCLKSSADAYGFKSLLTVGGTATFNGTGAQTAFTIAHGLGSTPSRWNVNAGSSAATGAFYVAADATNLTVTYIAAPASGTSNVSLVWTAGA